MYWNISLDKGGISRWGWAQNSLVVVDPDTKTFHYTPEYYVMKHLSHYVQPGARKLETSGQFSNLMAFVNSDKSIVAVSYTHLLYLQSYALYFSKFIEAYREQGIDIFAVMPQNEFNSAQIFPSCCWTAASLANFVGNYLGPVSYTHLDVYKRQVYEDTGRAGNL